MTALQTALLGFTGFVGNTLLRSRTYTDLYNSSNIQSIRGKEYDCITVAAVSAEKWKANLDAEADLEKIQALLSDLGHVSARKCLLVSTVDVYPSPIDVDESSEIDRLKGHAYGRNRLYFEDALRERFDCTVIRLPGLFGLGLKKNIIFDFLSNKLLEKIDSRSSFQFYDLKHLHNDIDTIVARQLELVNLVVEPVATADVARICLGREFNNNCMDTPARYDVRSIHAQSTQSTQSDENNRSGDSVRNGYFYTAAQCLADLRQYVELETR